MAGIDIDPHVTRMIEVALPYWDGLWTGRDCPPGLAALLALPARRGLGRPEHRLGRAAALLLDQWEPDRLGRFLDATATDRDAAEAATTVARHLLALGRLPGHLPPADVERWARGPLHGNLDSLSRAHDLALRWGLLSPGDWPPPWPADAWDGGVHTGRLFLDRDTILPGAVGARAATPLRAAWYELAAPVLAPFPRLTASQRGELGDLLAYGWPAGLLHRLLRDAGERQAAVLRALWELRFVPPGQLTGWQEAFSPAGVEPLSWSPRLPVLVRLWQSTGLPGDVIPWCAAAGVAPREAVAMHGYGTLDPGRLRHLAALNRL